MVFTSFLHERKGTIDYIFFFFFLGGGGGGGWGGDNSEIVIVSFFNLYLDSMWQMMERNGYFKSFMSILGG